MNRLFIGGSGLLGSNIRKDIDAKMPVRKEFDITKPDMMLAYLLKHYSSEKLDDCILAAAYTNVAASNKECALVYEVNINAPRNFIKCINAYAMITGWSPRITYISTDYVFNGDKGMYKTTDTICPVQNNYYAYSKAVGEEIIQTYNKTLIIRTSFCKDDDKWPYAKAFTDKFTSADKISIIAPLIAKYIIKKEYGIVHVGTERKNVFELAKSISPEVLPDSRKNFIGINVPYDTSLEITPLT
jgi:dTDP-4-dehydrorhamnose reductase